MTALQNNLPLVSRILFAVLFLPSGLAKLGDWGGNIGYMESKGFFLAPLFLVGAIVVEVLGSLLVLAGWRARLGAAALAAFTLLAALTMHNFWSVEDPMARMMEMINFMKNLAIAGGLLLIVAFGPGARSFNDK
jgi:putative oxidoreductase